MFDLERGYGGGRPSCSSGMPAYRDICGGARSPGTAKNSFSSRRAPDQWCRHGGGFGFHSDYVVRGTSDYAGAAATAIATPAIPKTVMVVGVNIWPPCLGHLNERTMQAAQNIAETGVNFTDSLTACDICKNNKGTKQSIHNEPDKTEITERL